MIIGDIKSMEDISHGWYLLYHQSRLVFDISAFQPEVLLVIVNLQQLFLNWSNIPPFPYIQYKVNTSRAYWNISPVYYNLRNESPHILFLNCHQTIFKTFKTVNKDIKLKYDNLGGLDLSYLTYIAWKRYL